VSGGPEDGDALAPVVPSDAELRSLLGEARTIAIVGISSKTHRESYQVGAYLQGKGYRIVPVTPKETQVLGERAYASLDEIPDDVPIDVVDVFRRAEHTPPIAEAAVRRGAKVLWLQEGIVNQEARAIAEAGGLTVIMGVCIKKTRKRMEEES